MSAGKGSVRRPQTIADEQFAARWDEIFGREKADVGIPVSDFMEGPRNDAEAWMMVNGIGLRQQMTRQQIRECFEKDDLT